jgi:hypothetical protein
MELEKFYTLYNKIIADTCNRFSIRGMQSEDIIQECWTYIIRYYKNVLKNLSEAEEEKEKEYYLRAQIKNMCITIMIKYTLPSSRYPKGKNILSETSFNKESYPDTYALDIPWYDRTKYNQDDNTDKLNIIYDVSSPFEWLVFSQIKNDYGELKYPALARKYKIPQRVIENVITRIQYKIKKLYPPKTTKRLLTDKQKHKFKIIKDYYNSTKEIKFEQHKKYRKEIKKRDKKYKNYIDCMKIK